MTFTTKSFIGGASIVVNGVFDNQSSKTSKDIMLSFLRKRLSEDINQLDFVPYKREYVTQRKEVDKT